MPEQSAKSRPGYTKLYAEFGFTQREATWLASGLEHLTPVLGAAFDKWWHARTPTSSIYEVPDVDLEVGGVTLSQLMRNDAMNAFVAFVTFDQLVRNQIKSQTESLDPNERVIEA